MKQQVYIVEGYTPYEGGEVLAVFLNKDKAEAYAKELQGKKGKRWDYYDANPYPLEDAPESL